MLTLLFSVLVALGTSFACSILEAAILSVSLPTLSDQESKGSLGAKRLLELKQKRLDDLISAILTLNTLANTLGASLAGAEAAALWGSQLLGIFSGLLALLILVFAEIIPKTLGSLYANQLAPIVGHVAYFLVTLMRPLLVLTRTLTRALAPERPKTVSSGELSAMIALAAADGSLPEYQSRVFFNLLELEELKLEEIMTPRTVLRMLSAQNTLGDLVKMRTIEPHSRVPLFGRDQDDVIGYVLVREALFEAARGKNLNTELRQYCRPITFLPRSLTVGNALRRLSERREQMAVVVDEFGGTSGLVTLEDLFETVLGTEILDESDRVADLQQVALKLRDRRLTRLSTLENARD